MPCYDLIQTDCFLSVERQSDIIVTHSLSLSLSLSVSVSLSLSLPLFAEAAQILHVIK